MQTNTFISIETSFRVNLGHCPARMASLRPLVCPPKSGCMANTVVRGQLYEGPNHTLHAELTGLRVGSDSLRLSGSLRFENGSIDVLKRGFKLCATAVGTQMVCPASWIATGSLQLLDGTPSTLSRPALVASLAACTERAAVLAVLKSSDRIAQHTRVFRYIRSHGLVDKIGNTLVDLPDGRMLALTEVQTRSRQPDVQVFFATDRNTRLSHLHQTRGNIVVQLPSDNHKRRAVVDFLVTQCNATPLDGRVE